MEPHTKPCEVATTDREPLLIEVEAAYCRTLYDAGYGTSHDPDYLASCLRDGFVHPQHADAYLDEWTPSRIEAFFHPENETPQEEKAGWALHNYPPRCLAQLADTPPDSPLPPYVRQACRVLGFPFSEEDTAVLFWRRYGRLLDAQRDVAKLVEALRAHGVQPGGLDMEA